MPAKTHGASRNLPEYEVWRQMRARCRNPNHPEYHRYGGRGITVCERWHDFAAFYADMGPRPDGLSIDRVDNDGGYEPANCRWATIKEQNANKRKGTVPFRKSAPLLADIKRLHAQGLSTRAIAKEVGLSKSQVWKLV